MEGAKLTAITGSKKKRKPKGEIEIAKCRRCERDTGVANIDFGVMHTGGYVQDGKIKDTRKTLYCLHCHARDGYIEIIAYL